MLYPPKFGAYTELYAGWSPDITLKTNGSYIVPWGRIGRLRGDIELALKSNEEGGSGQAEEFWRWCERETSDFM